MSEFKGTPGKWYLDSEGDVTSDTGEVALVWYKPVENEANARLIAAAPDLLEALIAMEAEKADYMQINNLGEPAEQHTIKQARSAIAKALQS